ncbi:MAG: nuclease [Dehalococcoidales bacterium]|jgi:micrococcal nuclease|nr:nuclease [Dehalococcoidales bacterium]|tara:strand:- start:160 stop:846 length:687 start_codon:yes stop_codon:yes gene_type:complete
MNRLVIYTTAICSLLLLTSCTAPFSQTSAPQPQVLTEAQVVRVVDGDTIEVNIGGHLYKVRYIGIDTPETVHPDKSIPEPYGKEATTKNKELVEGKIVTLEKDISETDKYGRLLRYAYVGDTFINAELVRLGYAQVVTYPPDVKYQDLFLQLQKEAREEGRGLWAIQPSQIPATNGEYVGSIKSDKYHYPSCRYVSQTNPENIIEFSSATEAQAMGYVPCKVCNPPTN